LAKILLLEDDLDIRSAIEGKLIASLYVVDGADSGDLAIDFVSRYEYDLALLDINVPGPSGLEVLHYIRSHAPDTKVILLTSLSSVEDKLKGFGGGADDYLSKPFDMRELMARIAALLKRPTTIAEDITTIGDYVVDRNRVEVRKRGELIKIQPKDFSLLDFLMRHPKETFSSETLLDRVWSADSNASVDGLRMSVSRLRKALDDPDKNDSIIVSVNRVGYKLGL